MGVKIQVKVFSVVMLCSVHQCFRGPCCQGKVKMEAANSSVPLKCWYPTKQHHNPKDVDLNHSIKSSERRQNLQLDCPVVCDFLKRHPSPPPTSQHITL